MSTLLVGFRAQRMSACRPYKELPPSLAPSPLPPLNAQELQLCLGQNQLLVRQLMSHVKIRKQVLQTELRSSSGPLLNPCKTLDQLFHLSEPSFFKSGKWAQYYLLFIMVKRIVFFLSTRIHLRRQLLLIKQLLNKCHSQYLLPSWGSSFLK